MSFRDNVRKQNLGLGKLSISKKKQVKPVKVVNYNINAANCNVLTMMQYVHCLRNINNQSTAICRQIIRLDIAVKYFCDNITVFITTRYRYVFFCKYNAQNLVWNWYGSMKDCLPFHSWNLSFHSILASFIFHTEVSVQFHFPFHSIPCPDCRFLIITPTVVASLKIRKRLILKNLLPLPAPFQYFRFRVRFRFQPLSSKCFRFHKKFTASTPSTFLV